MDDSMSMSMPVMPAYGAGGNQSGFGFGGDWAWILLLLVLFGNNGWGNGNGGGMGGLYPWMNNSQNINSGFRDQMINDNITSIRDGVYGISNQLCNGFSGTTAAITGAQNAISQQMYANEISSLNRSFAEQTANTQGFTGVNTGLADLKYTVATENCADRYASAQNTRDIIDSQTRGTQAILDKLCALELDGVKSQLAQAQRENTGLQNQLNMANLAASQTAQNTQIVDGIYNRLASCPVGCQPVYGNQPIFTCNNGLSSCGCSGTI